MNPDKLYHDYVLLWHTHNKTHRLKEIKKKIKLYLKRYNIKYSFDNAGNMFLGDFSTVKPCLVAHIDSVHDKAPARVRLKNNILTCDVGIGADDKAGIVAILELLQDKSIDVNAILTIDEEIGGEGAQKITPKSVRNVAYFIEIDRKGKDEIICTSGENQIASDEMQADFEKIAPYFGFRLSNDGIYTDVNELTQISGKSAVNLSAGYYNAHTPKEYINLKELQNTISFVKTLVTEYRKVYTWTEEQLFYSFGKWDHIDSYWYDDEKETALFHLLTEAETMGNSKRIKQLIREAFDLGFYEGQEEYNTLKKWY